ncbi:hypothetical protein [Roseibium sp. SCP14]
MRGHVIPTCFGSFSRDGYALSSVSPELLSGAQPSLSSVALIAKMVEAS